ncbi:MAG: glycosyltransferase family 4 protein [Candidatus Omnitrophota bacterium]
MNILYLTNHLNTGGITSYLLTLAGALKQNGHNVYLASSGGELLERFLEKGIKFIPIPVRTKSEASPGVMISFFKLQVRLKEYRIELIHANTRVTQVLACLLAGSSGRPYVSTCHGFFKKRFSRLVFPCWGKKVIAISSQVKEHLVNDFNLPEDKIRVIHNGIDAIRFRERRTENGEQRKRSLGLDNGPLVGIIARLSEVKGHIYLIEAMSEVIKRVPEAQLLIVGEGRIQKDLESLINRLGIGRKVKIIPSVEDTAGVLSIIDVFVMPSLQEGLGLGLMEAMACGCAVVATNVGGMKTLIQDGENGLLVEAKDAGGLAVKIIDLLTDAGKRASLGKNARDFISGNFSQEKMAGETERLYEECVKTDF